MYAPTSPIGRSAPREIDLRDLDLRRTSKSRLLRRAQSLFQQVGLSLASRRVVVWQRCRPQLGDQQEHWRITVPKWRILTRYCANARGQITAGAGPAFGSR